MQLTKALVERSLQAELTHHLGYEKHDPVGHHSGNTRNGASAKTIQGKRGQMQIEVPRDRQSQFEPQIIKKGQRRFDGFDERVISLYARGLSVREIQGPLEEIYGTEVSPDLISTVTGEVLDEVRAWQSRPLDAVSPIVYLDALQVKIRDDGRVANRAISLGHRNQFTGPQGSAGDVGLAKRRRPVLAVGCDRTAKPRGTGHLRGRVTLGRIDGLKGFPEAIEAVFPQTQVQL